MPSYLTATSIWSALWPIPLSALIIAGFLLLLHRNKGQERLYFLVVLSFAFLGHVTGLLAGFSRQPTMGAVLPAVLSLVGALAIYLIAAKKADQGLVAVCVIALSLGLLVSTLWGAALRDEFEQMGKSKITKMNDALDEVEVRDFRRSLGLPDTPPSSQLNPSRTENNLSE